MGKLLKGKRGFYNIEKGSIYYRLFDNNSSLRKACQIKAMHELGSGKFVIYSERDREFLLVESDISTMHKLGKVLTRGMSIIDILTVASKRKIFHDRISYSRIPWEEVSIYNNDNRFYHYLKNI